MPLTPLDIHNKEFSRRIRGYDEDEVNEFLDQVIKDYEIVIRENKEPTTSCWLCRRSWITLPRLKKR